MKAKAGDIYCVYNKHLKRYTACQITKLFYENEKELAVHLVLEWVGDEILVIEELTSLRPLAMDFMCWDMDKYLLNVNPEVPKDYIYIGNIHPITDENTNSYSNWDNGYSIYRQMKWLEIPENKRRLFKEAMKSDNDKCVNIKEQEVRINTKILSDSQYDFDSAKELFVLPCLYELRLEKWHSDIYEYLVENPFLITLEIKGHNQKVLDFRESHLRKLVIDITDVDELYLSNDMEEVYLSGMFTDNVRVHAKNQGSNLLLGFTKNINFNLGCKRLSQIQCFKTEEADIAKILLAYPDLMSLRLWGKPGYIRNYNEIKSFEKLSTFTTVDMFGFCKEDIPKPEEVPELKWFWMSSLPEDAAKEARRLYKNEVEYGMDFWIKKARKPEWLEENLENPFRAWDGQDSIPVSMAKKATIQYKKTLNDIKKINFDSIDNAIDELLIVITNYTEAFNKMNKNKGFIETVEREDIYVALCELIDAIPSNIEIDKDIIFELFDSKRDF